MAKGPKELLELTDQDSKAVSALESYIDNHPDMKSFDGNNVKITFSTDIIEKYLSVRYNVRTDELRRKYMNAGWGEVIISYQYNNPKIIELRRYEQYDR